MQRTTQDGIARARGNSWPAVTRHIARRTAAAIALLAAVATGAPIAHAAGLCIAQNPSSTIFLQRFRIPAKGKCLPVTARIANGLEANGGAGQACRTTDGTSVRVGLTAFIDGAPRFFEAAVPLPVGNPTAILRTYTFGSQNTYTTTAWSCTVP